MTASLRRLLHRLLAIAVVVSFAGGQEPRPPQDPPASERPRYTVIDVRPDGAPASDGTATPQSKSISTEKFEAPKAQLFRIVMRGVFDELQSRGPFRATMVVLLLLLFFQGLPLFLTWDFAKGAGRSTWIWLALAAIGSWFVLPVIWITSTVAHRTADDRSTRGDGQGRARARAYCRAAARRRRIPIPGRSGMGARRADSSSAPRSTAPTS